LIKYFAVSEKARIFAVDKSTSYHEVINEETAIFASRVVQPPLKEVLRTIKTKEMR
jgi:hypothetical protein